MISGPFVPFPELPQAQRVACPHHGLRASATNSAFPLGWNSGNAGSWWLDQVPRPSAHTALPARFPVRYMGSCFETSHLLPSFWILAVAFQPSPTVATLIQMVFLLVPCKLGPASLRTGHVQHQDHGSHSGWALPILSTTAPRFPLSTPPTVSACVVQR